MRYNFNRLMQLQSISEIIVKWISFTNSNYSNVINHSLSKNNYSMSKLELIHYSSDLLSQIDTYKSIVENLVGCDSDDVHQVLLVFTEIEKSIRFFTRP